MSRPSPIPHPDQIGFDLAEHTLGQLPSLVARSGWAPPTELPSLRGVARIGLDTETCDPDLKEAGPGFRRGAYIVGISIAIPDVGAWYLPTRHQGGGNLDEGLVRRWARQELGEFTGEIVGANLGYDLDALATCWDVHLTNVRGFHDVIVAEPIIDEWKQPDEYRLENIAQQYLGYGKDETLLKEAAARYGATTNAAVKKVLWRLPAGVVGAYAEADAAEPLEIIEKQLAILEREGLMPAYEIERQLIPILVEMRRHGVRIDVGRAHEIRARLVKERDAYVAKLKHLAGPKAELLEPASLGLALEHRGIVVPRTAKTGQYSVTKPFLERFQDDELVATLLGGRKVNTMINTFIDGQILSYNVKGRVHPTFNQLKNEDAGTIGRFSGSNPNLQFIPARDAELAPLIRGLFLPDDDDSDWQRDDASQIEYRFLADCAVGRGSDEVRAAYNADPKTDFHKLCSRLLGADPEDGFIRKRVKNTNFCKVYGGGIKKVAATFGCSEEEAAVFVRMYDEELPFVNATYQAAMKWAARHGYVTTIIGSKQRFPFWEPMNNYDRSMPPLRHEAALAAYGPRIQRAATFTALNKKLQIGAAYMLKIGMVNIHREGLQRVIGPTLVTVHDELGHSVPRTRAGDEAGREVTHLMETAVKLRVPILVESSRGSSWGDCK